MFLDVCRHHVFQGPLNVREPLAHHTDDCEISSRSSHWLRTSRHKIAFVEMSSSASASLAVLMTSTNFCMVSLFASDVMVMLKSVVAAGGRNRLL